MNKELPAHNQEPAARELEIRRQNEALLQESEALRRELHDRIREWEEATRRRGRFLSAVAHDVRTPASAIGLMAEVIKQAGQNPEMLQELPQLAESLKSNAKLLVDLVNDVLELLKFDAKRIELDEYEFDLGEMLQEVVDQHQRLASAAGTTLRVTLPSPTIWIRTDQLLLDRVLRDLIDNAIKFTPAGTVDVRCIASPDGIDLQVQDSGVGIHEDQLEFVFDEFYQINNSSRDRTRGTGLSLAICIRLVEAIDCTLHVESFVGKGSTFTIRIPRRMVRNL